MDIYLLQSILNTSIRIAGDDKDPIIFRATEQWFVSIDAFRNEALEAVKSVRWIPEWG